MKSQISPLNDPLPSLGKILGKWFDLGGSWLKPLPMTLLLLLPILIAYIVLHKLMSMHNAHAKDNQFQTTWN